MTRQTSISADPATDYAKKVKSGQVIAGPIVRNACIRHLKDLKNGHERGLHWDVDAANHVINFYSDVLCLNGGEFEGVSYDLLPWQCFVVGSIFGWKNADGTRRFRVAYIETAKGSGKSPLAAGIGLYGLTADGEERAEIYSAATKKDQAMVLFRDAVAMVDYSPMLNERIVRSGGWSKEWNLAYPHTNGFFRALSSDDGQSGPRPHMALLDEIHEHKDNTVVEMLRSGVKGRRQPLIGMITNSGTSRNSVCWEYHDYADKVCKSAIIDDTFFAYVCALDKEDDPFKDESCWIKANPSLGITIQHKYLHDQVTQARGMPSKEGVVRRLNFCQWLDAVNGWIPFLIWEQCKDTFGEKELLGRKCRAALDLSSTQDLTSATFVFEPTADDPYWRVLPYFWLPEMGLSEKADKDKVPYQEWRHKGYLEVTPGRAVDKAVVMMRLAQICDLFDCEFINYDRWRIEDAKAIIEREGISLPPLIPHGQGFKDMGPAVDQTEILLINAKIKHPDHPILNWCAANAVISIDPANNKKLDKQKATGRIDGMVTMVMGIGGESASTQDKTDDDQMNEYLRDVVKVNRR